MVLSTGTPLHDMFVHDIELFGLISGLRPVAKKEGADALRLMAASETLRGDGWFVAMNPRTGCAYLSRDGGRARRLMELENVEFDGGNPVLRRQTIREIGLALGYPDCCASAFAALPVQDDSSVMDAMFLKSRATRMDLPWQMNFLVPMTGPVFYYPCGFDCQSSLELADRYLAAMDALRPGTSGRMRAVLAHPVVAAGRWDFVVLDGRVMRDGSVAYTSWRKAADYHPVPPSTRDFADFLDALPQAGVIRVDGRDILAGPDDGSGAVTVTFRAGAAASLLNYI